MKLTAYLTTFVNAGLTSEYSQTIDDLRTQARLPTVLIASIIQYTYLKMNFSEFNQNYELKEILGRMSELMQTVVNRQ